VARRKNKTKYYTFLLVPDDEKEAKSLKLNANLIRFLIVFAVFLLIVIVSGAATYWKVASLAVEYYSVMDENDQLKQSLDKFEEVKKDFEKIKMMDQKLRSSLSGYVKIKENAEEVLNENNQFEFSDFGSHESAKSLFNSLPDLLPVEGFITRGIEAKSFSKDLHLGIDIAATKGTPVKATADGLVIFSGYTIEEGNVVILKHRDNFYSFYKHNLTNLCSELEFVKKGQAIALLGDTGEVSSGAHVHFEIWKGQKPVDPLIYIRGAEEYLR
jgi:murein DD-endopeptidase MepM/ murein hydrolase activator NlpD